MVVSATSTNEKLSGIESVRVAMSRLEMQVESKLETRNSTEGTARNEFAISVKGKFSSSTSEQREHLLANVDHSVRGAIPFSVANLYVGNVAGDPHQQLLFPGRKEREFLVEVSHFLPDRFVQRFNMNVRRQREIDALVYAILHHSDPTTQRYSTFPGRTLEIMEAKLGLDARREIDAVISGFHGNQKLSKLESDTIGGTLLWASLASLKGAAKNKFTERVGKIVAAYIMTNFFGESKKSNEVGLEVVSNNLEVALIEAATAKTTFFFSSMLRYLGPLRADPYAAQGFAPSSEPDDVGIKGEFAAAVFDANRDANVFWVDPETYLEKETSLQQAVDWWANHLGVAHHISTKEAGLSGMSWFVQHLPGARERPLQAVGVGVSQILPVLVAGLLPQRGAVILFEQPELHLHSRAQSRLGDFFLSLAASGKQCIIETHSSSLVSQLRLNLVKRREKVDPLLGIYFADQDEEGQSRFEKIKISPKGNIVNWPDGFFDESMKQEDLITQTLLMTKK